jgi:hypothetical protein
MLKKSARAFSLRSEAQHTESYASTLRSLRPCWTAFLSILLKVGSTAYWRELEFLFRVSRTDLMQD